MCKHGLDHEGFLKESAYPRPFLCLNKASQMRSAWGYQTQHHETSKAGDMIWGSQSAIDCPLCACFDTRKADEQNPEAAFWKDQWTEQTEVLSQ